MNREWIVEGTDEAGKRRRLRVKANDHAEASGKAYTARGVIADNVYPENDDPADALSAMAQDVPVPHASPATPTPRGMGRCRSCGHTVGSYAKLCPQCGAASPGVSASTMGIRVRGKWLTIIGGVATISAAMSGPLTPDSEYSDLNTSMPRAVIAVVCGVVWLLGMALLAVGHARK